MSGDYIPLYMQAYQLYEHGIPISEIARRLYGFYNRKTYVRVKALIHKAKKRLNVNQTWLTHLYKGNLGANGYSLYDPRTGYRIFVPGLVLEERLPESEFHEPYIPHASPVTSSMTSMGTIFNVKSLGKTQSNPPGGLGEERIVYLNEALEELNELLGLLGVPEDSIVREEAARLIHVNKGLLEDNLLRRAVVVSTSLISVAVHRPGLLERSLKLINELYDDIKPYIISTIYKMKIPDNLISKVFRGLLEFLVNRS